MNAATVKTRLTGKVGPLPLYGWLLLAAAGYLYYRHRQANSPGTDQQSATGDYSTQPVPFYGSTFSSSGLGWANGTDGGVNITNAGGGGGGGGTGGGGSGGGSGGSGGSGGGSTILGGYGGGGFNGVGLSGYGTGTTTTTGTNVTAGGGGRYVQ